MADQRQTVEITGDDPRTRRFVFALLDDFTLLSFASAVECLQFEQESFGALHQMLSGLSDAERDEAWNEIEDALGQFENKGQFEGPCEMLVAVGTK